MSQNKTEAFYKKIMNLNIDEGFSKNHEYTRDALFLRIRKLREVDNGKNSVVQANY